MVRLESFHRMSYYRNNIQECVLQGDYGCDSDAVDVRRRWGLLVLIAVLQLVEKTTREKIMSVLLYGNCETHIFEIHCFKLS